MSDSDVPGDAALDCELYRDAALLLALAQRALVENAVPDSVDPASARAVFDVWAAANGGSVAQPGVWADATAGGSYRANRERWSQICRDLLRSLDLRSRFAVRATRYGRMLALVVVLAWPILPLASRLRHGPNVLRGAAVTASSRFPGTPDPSGLTNGDVESRFAGHTTKEKDSWFLIDLGQARHLAEVRVFPRGDGYLNDSVPVVMETSADGVTFAQVGSRADVYTQAAPWTVRSGMDARFIRIRMPGLGYLALSEVEGYAR
ncbi:MAG: discoidin domain-containing protein [Polyangiaceae bacterium]|nr:discoidin domain-containing protein [Polyangiaceae bacterium]